MIKWNHGVEEMEEQDLDQDGKKIMCPTMEEGR